MKRFLAIIMVFISLSGFGQTAISSYPLSVSYQKTTNIIFPYRIEMADIGSGDVIGHKEAILPNVLFLKANRKGFAPTNLSVYTADGKLYSFIVQYKENPDSVNLCFSKIDNLKLVISDSINDARLDSDAVLIQNQDHFMHRRTSSEQMKVVLRGIYIIDHLMWFKMEIFNHSEVEFQPESIRFSVRDKHTGKRTAVQENEKIPVWQSPNDLIPGQKSKTIIYAFPAFTMDKHKKLSVNITEKNGGRLLIIPIGNKTLLKAHKWKNDTL